jgi:hypothetical protein
MSGFRGYNQAAGRGAGPKSIGPVSQRDLVRLLCPIIDAAKAKASSRTRDDARKTLRHLLNEAHWQTPYVRQNLGVRRCRYIAGLGYPMPAADMERRADIERLEQWLEKRG